MEEEIKELQSIDIDIENKTELLEMTQSDEETAMSMQGDIITIENNIRKIRQLNVQIEDLQATLGCAGINSWLVIVIFCVKLNGFFFFPQGYLFNLCYWMQDV